MTSHSIVFDRAAEYYDDTRGYAPLVAQRVAASICDAGDLGQDSSVLEVGVGTGRIALPLAARVGRVLGIDMSRPMLARLQTKRVDERVQPLIADAAALPFPDACFDAVVTVHVFHLLPDWRRALAEIRRVLVPGGRLLDASDDQLLPELWQATYASAPKLANVGVPSGVVDFPLQVGFTALGSARELHYGERVELATFLRRIEDRVWSVTWRMSDGEHAHVVAEMRRAIIARYGSLDAAVDTERTFTVRAFTPA